MKNKDLQDLKNKSVENLKKFIADRQKELTVKLIEQVTNKAKNVHQPSNIKKDIAQAKTILQAKVFVQKQEVTNGTK